MRLWRGKPNTSGMVSYGLAAFTIRYCNAQHVFM